MKQDFNEAFEAQRERSRQDYYSGKVEEQVTEAIFEGKTSFVGYGIEGSTKARDSRHYCGWRSDRKASRQDR